MLRSRSLTNPDSATLLAPERGAPRSGVQSSLASGDAAPPIKVIYIAGYGRSGSTLLDIALGQSSAVLGAGEITALSRHVWDRGEYCACGRSVTHCQVWRNIVQTWRTDGVANFPAVYRRAQLWRELLLSPTRLIDRLRGPERVNHLHDTAKLFRRIAAVGGRPVIVDSSKLPGRGLMLADVAGIELYVVHLVRDPRGVAWSLRKAYKPDARRGVQRELRPKSVLYTSFRWSTVNLMTEMLCRKVGRGRSLRVKYEDFVADPDATVRAILSMVHGSAVHEPVIDPAGVITPHHQMAGSRHRMQKTIAFRKDCGWHDQMPPSMQRQVSMLCGSLMRRYGYGEIPA
jgi:hypothetical protein